MHTTLSPPKFKHTCMLPMPPAQAISEAYDRAREDAKTGRDFDACYIQRLEEAVYRVAEGAVQ